MREKKTRWFRYTAEDAKAAQAELDRQASEGWELEEVGLFTATFRRSARPRPCWVEPARWTSIRRKDETARTDYLALCGDAGWELASEDGGLFYFRAKEGADPVPVQTDGTVEWEDVWKKALHDQTWSVAGLLIYWLAWAAGSFWRDRPRVWELFLSNHLMAAQLLIFLWLGLEIFLLARVIRYRSRCRRAAEGGAPFPVPRRWAARLQGAWPLIVGALLAVTFVVLLLAIDEGEPRYIDGYSAYTEESNSLLADSFEYRRFSQAEGDLWVERYDCKTGWLAGWICDSLRREEGALGESVRTRLHFHGAVLPQAAELGFDQTWTYVSGEVSGLILRQGDQVLHLESDSLDMTDAGTLEGLRAWLGEEP